MLSKEVQVEVFNLILVSFNHSLLVV